LFNEFGQPLIDFFETKSVRVQRSRFGQSAIYALKTLPERISQPIPDRSRRILQQNRKKTQIAVLQG
jgi:hypothetical protein